jgi:hypothetical protein
MWMHTMCYQVLHTLSMRPGLWATFWIATLRQKKKDHDSDGMHRPESNGGLPLITVSIITQALLGSQPSIIHEAVRAQVEYCVLNVSTSTQLTYHHKIREILPRSGDRQQPSCCLQGLTKASPGLATLSPGW